jgi:hypothetical protein
MDAHDYSIRHFEDMARFATALKALPAQVLEHSYSYDSFGSWWTVVRCNGFPLRVVFDGRDRELVLEASEARKPPYTWGVAVWRKTTAPGESAIGEELLAAIREAARRS